MDMPVNDDLPVGQDGNDVIPIFLKNDDGTLVYVTDLPREDCFGMNDLYDVSDHVILLVQAAGVILPPDFFPDFEIPLERQYLDGDYFKVPHDVDDAIFAVTRVVLSYHAPNPPINEGEGADSDVTDPEVV